MRLALYQPDIPQNTGTLLRLAACLGVGVDIIGPTGFDMSDRSLRRAALDYLPFADISRHTSWQSYLKDRAPGRLVLLSSRGATNYVRVRFEPSDTLLLGRESAGVPDAVRTVADATVRIPMRPQLRSLNVAVAGAMVLGEALRQTGGFDDLVATTGDESP